jgi:hypothetical protein
MPVHEGEVALFDNEFGQGRAHLYVAPRHATLDDERASFIRYCAKQSGGVLTSADISDIVDCFGGSRLSVVAQATALDIPIR